MTILNKLRRKTESRAKPVGPGMIGLDIGTNQIHMCQIRPLQHGLFSIVAKASIDYPGSRQALLEQPRKLKALIAPALKQKKFKGKRVAALMPWEEVKIILLTYKANVADVDSEVVKMLAKRIDGSIDDYVVDYVPVRSNPSDEEHMVVATLAKREAVDLLLQTLISCGLEVDSLDIAPTALRRIVSALYTGHAADNVLMINTYHDESYLTVISGRRLLFSQSVPFGESLLLDSIARELDISADSARTLIADHGLEKQAQSRAVGAETETDVSTTLLEIVKPCFLDLINEINRVLVFTASETHGVPVSRICLLGSIAQWPGAQQVLLSLLDFDAPDGQTEFTQVFQDENENTRVPWEGLFSEISIAMGLALRGLVANE
ncbi:MAG: pilus assembly protein PilM [Gammaproteobacteria bacterium]|nr:pilus assembly protein PilM [Gammaproteobacteria bacterium]MDH3857309.1 pilus assembly protein PilM [Gammaproteobacteria bacterium]